MENTALNQQGESVDEISSITLRYISSVRFVIPTKSILELERKIYTWLKKISQSLSGTLQTILLRKEISMPLY